MTSNMKEALANFSFQLLHLVGKENEDTFFSPASIETALFLCFAGSNGPTKDQMRNVLFADIQDEIINETMQGLVKHLNLNDENVQQTSAIRMYCKKSFSILQSYQDALQTTCNAEILSVDFQSNSENIRKEINDWVSMRTHNKINDLIPQGAFGEFTRLVLVNALYFKGEWLKTFERELTTKMQFHVNAQKVVDVDMMYQQGSFLYAETEECQALMLDYKSNQIKMLICLPKDKQGLAKFEQQFDGSKLLSIIESMQACQVKIKLPKLKFEQSFNLNENLKALGIVDAFDQEKSDFSNITGTKDLYISTVLHKAFIEMNEDGTEAAAATSAIADCWLKMPINKLEPKEFFVDHPFLFAILGKDSFIYFLGHFYHSKV